MTDKKYMSLKLDKKGLERDYLEYKEQTTLDSLFEKKEESE